MNKFTKLSLTLPLVVFVAACGGGDVIVEDLPGNTPIDTDGDGVIDTLDAFPQDASETLDTDNDGVGDNADAFPQDASETLDTDNDGVGDNSDPLPNISGTNLATLSPTTSVQLLTQLGDSVEIDNDASKPAAYTTSLTYVADNTGDIYGVAAESIPTGVSFSAENAANVAVQMGVDHYTLTNGTVDGSIDSISGDLSVMLSFRVDDIAFDSEQGNAIDVSTNMQLSMDSTLSGTSDCGAANVFCGGTLQVLKDNAEAASATLGATDYVTGVYGTENDPEIGGVINYEDPGELAVVGSFVAGKE
jgi:hypothetical protein